jgi:hypothetical protein
MIYKDLEKKFPGYEIILTGWELKERAPWLGLSFLKIPIGSKEWDNVEIEEYEVEEKPHDIYSFKLGEKHGKTGHSKGTVWAKAKKPKKQTTTVAVPNERYEELLAKERTLDEMIQARRRGADKANAISAEERKARAKKAVEARIKKYNQKSHTH